MQTLDRGRLGSLHEAERERFVAEHPRSKELFERAKASLHDGVPMNWMVRWASPFPPFVETAEGASFRCVDGHEYIDFCLGDTGAMAGHGAAATVAAVERQLRRGITHMLPTEDAIWVGEELQRRFGLPYWQFTLSATDANRFALRLGRQITGRSKVVVHDYCYHGTVDETFAVLDDDGADGGAPRVDRAAGRLGETTRVVEFNDIDGLERALEDRDVAVVLFEPALTNIGIVLPDDGLPRRRPRAHAADRHPPVDRRDPHDLRRAGRSDEGLGPRTRHARDRQDDRWRDPGRDVRDDAEVADADPAVGQLRGRRRRRDRRDARRLRAVAGRRPGRRSARC